MTIPTLAPPITTDVLRRVGDTDVNAVAHLVFGRLVKLSSGVLHAYHSDLWHDAFWLQHNLSGTRYEFFWAVGDYGTELGTDALLVATAREHAYRFTVAIDSYRTVLNVVDLTGLAFEDIDDLPPFEVTS